MNKLFLIGNLTQDPEVRTTTTGVSVCTFSIAVSRRFSGQNGEKQTDYFRINAWRGLGDTCAKYLAKGRKVAVVGELQARTYQAKDGSMKMSLDVSADEVEFLTPRGQSEAGASPFAPTPMQPPMQNLSGFTEIDEDELPF